MKLHFISLFVLIFSINAFGDDWAKIRLSTLKSPSASVIDGENHYLYELVIENQSPANVQLRVLNIDGGTLGQLKFDEAQINSRFKLLGQVDLDTVSDWLAQPATPAPTPGIIPAGRSALIYLEIISSASVKAPIQIRHSLTIDQGTPQSVFTLNYDVSVTSAAPLVLASPFADGLWFPFNGPNNDSQHRRSVQKLRGRYYIGQRFAIDWGRIGDGGYILRPSTSSKLNTSYFGYGTPVYAVADAVVSEITDDIPENTPDTDTRAVTINLQTVAGNQVILDLGSGHYALYAHLQPGSLRVKKGDNISQGQLIGLLGNSGNSTGPHLHFHICDGPSALECQGIPYVFKSFTHQTVTAEGNTLPGLRFTPVGDPKTSIQELIWNNQQIDFSK